MKHNAVLFFLVLLVVIGSCVIGDYTAGPGAAPVVTRVVGDVRTVERFDAGGLPHGRHETYTAGRLTAETRYEHGQTVEQIFYGPDGAVREHWKEDENYEMHLLPKNP